MTSRAGSSPLARGLPDRPASTRRVRRIIPARAGFTVVEQYSLWDVWDHPRSRGVYAASASLSYPSTGSSPLARGLPVRLSAALRAGRIIPARAGFTQPRILRRTLTGDHPRSRGVYVSCGSITRLMTGSSPLARGLLGGDPCTDELFRIIPARAGFTRFGDWRVSAPQDHPRSRGVYSVRTRSGRPVAGSSPLARGLLAPRCVRGGDGGIIPARAGFTESNPRYDHPGWDHPRSRGVYAEGLARALRAVGSSPLARGLPNHLFWDEISLRIIPARAGFTGFILVVLSVGGDHPRSRGVYHLVTFLP